MQSKKIAYFVFALAVMAMASIRVYGQDGTTNIYTPYSVYGIGDLVPEGTGVSRLMGGTGIATRDHRTINLMNPAAVTARDSLSFMADFGLTGTNYLYRQGDYKSGKNTFNISDFAMSFPIYRSSAMMVGIAPYSNMGYDFSTHVSNPLLISNTGAIITNHSGKGGIYQVFAGAGVTFWRSLSLGVEGIYYFGSLDKTTDVSFSNTSYRNIASGHDLKLHAAAAKFGLQYELHLPRNTSLTVGATYRLPAHLKGYSDSYTIATISTVADTLNFSADTLGKTVKPSIPAELGLGISLTRAGRWIAEVNYTRSDWSKSKFDTTPGLSSIGDVTFTGGKAQSVKAGFAITPNRYDTRYFYRRCTYRGGAYYNESHFNIDGNSIRTFGLTFGITVPIQRFYNGVTFGVDIGQRGNTSGNNTRERYVTFNIAFNIHDLWFMKYRYE